MSLPPADPYGVADDPVMHTLGAALEPRFVARTFATRLSRSVPERTFIGMRSARVLRYKPARRCVFEYRLLVQEPGAQPQTVELIGKVRARRFGKSGYRLLRAFWNAGFRDDSPDGISVPQPLATVPALRMWLQRKVEGTEATELLGGSRGAALARRIAEAAHKVHRAGVPTERTHGMADELMVLEDRLRRLATTHPQLQRRLERLLQGARRIGGALRQPVPCGIHRDFYAEQVIVGRGRLWLIDFDLYCLGDPGLDIGNFIAHVTEQSLRTRGDPNALGHVEAAMEERFVELAGEHVRASVHTYATLTLMRHVYLSTLFTERRHTTLPLLELCESRLRLYPRRAA